jgi:hypothetical protein
MNYKTIERNILLVVITLSIILSIYKKQYNQILVIILSSGLFYLTTQNIYNTLLYSLLVFVIYKLTNSHLTEGYSNTGNIKQQQKQKNSGKKKPVKQSKKKKNKKNKLKESFKHNENYIDVGTNFLKAYENLTPNQIEGMTKDTKNLIGTQKKLMSTLNNLGPTLKEGKKVLDTFKNYFNENELLQ